MDIERLKQYLDDPDLAARWFGQLGMAAPERGHAHLLEMAAAGVTLDLLAVICEQLTNVLPLSSDPDRALNNLDRFVAASRSPLSLGSLLDRDPDALPTLTQIFSTSQYLSDWLIRDPASFDLLRLTEGQPVPRESLVTDVCTDVGAVDDDRVVMMILRRYKHRETLRIAYGDIVRRQPLETVTEQISFLADAIVEAAVQAAWRSETCKRGLPRLPDGQVARFTVLALGKLGGVELNYSSDIDLIFLSDGDGKTDGDRAISNDEFFARLAQRIVKLLTEPTDLGSAYRVDLRLRPQGGQSRAVWDWESALRYYDLSGRTWERQAFVKARVIAGDERLGNYVLDQLQPWIYRQYLTGADIAGIKALKRRIEQRTRLEEGNRRNIKTGEGGIRDIEFVIQFLQLLNGGDLPEIRTGNTLQAIMRLEHVRCLTLQERTMLEENYRFLRQIEHRLQIMFDLRTHSLPEDRSEMRRLAMRNGYQDTTERTALEQFEQDLRQKTYINRTILDHLLHESFGDSAETSPETDLILDPDPSPDSIVRCLDRHGFDEAQESYHHLMELAHEKIPFLSTRRCRQFLASIAPGLLTEISKTPDPAGTLISLIKVSDSLGGKGVLWELFNFSPPSMKLYVRLCASSPYLSGILTSNPGMIDELMDSLVLDKLPTLDILTETLSDLCRGAEDIEPILHSFKNSQHLRVGVRDILGKEDLRDSHRALSDIAETCLQRISQRQFQRLVAKYGMPVVQDSDGERDGELVIVAMGKLGGREPNYHSDLDVIFLYEEEGQTRATRRAKAESTTNQHFFSQLGQRIIGAVTKMGPHGRLYELDPRLRPTGESGSLAVSLPQFLRYFEEGQGQLWERQALCKARPIFGSEDACQRAMSVIRQAASCHAWQPESAEEIRRMRIRMQQHASDKNLKRGIGGTVDIEFIVQMLQMQNAAECPDVLATGTLDALDVLADGHFLSADDANYLARSYRFLRSVETGLRLMNTTARHDLPEDETELRKLAFLIRYRGPGELVRDCRDYRRKNREVFHRVFDAAVYDPTP